MTDSLQMSELNLSTDAIRVTQFSRRIADQLILYEVVRYPDRCLFIWIGNSSCEMSNLAMTMPGKDNLGTTLIGNDFYEQSLLLSKKLVRRFSGEKQIYVSLNLTNDADNEMLLSQVEQALFDHIRENQQSY